jgi:hypothetical protein
MLSAEGVRIVSAASASGTKHTVTKGQIRYEFRNMQGLVRAQGHLDDPRVLRSEFIENNAYGQLDIRASQGLTRVRLPSIEGDVILFGPTSQGVREIGRVHYAPKATGRTTHALLDSNKDILGKPIRLPGGDGVGKKLNILVLPEGFQESEMGAFHTAVESVAKAFKDVKAYAPYVDRIQIWRQDVRSKETGVDKPLSQLARETAFDIGYGDSAELERCTWFKSDKAMETAAALGKTVEAHVVVIIANDNGWGGCASGGLVVQTMSSDAGGVLAHEIGHAVFGLADEYTYGSCDTSAKGPNISASSKLEDLPWKSLVTTQALPTPAAENNAALVGAFEGAAYCTQGMFRPQLHCIMGEIGKPFCAVCTQQIEGWFGGKDSGKTDSSGTPGAAGSSATACGATPWEGACNGSTLTWCENEVLKTLDCAAQNALCGWDSASSFNNCLAAGNGSGGASPGGEGGSGGDPSYGGAAGSTGGTGATDPGSPTNCGTVTWIGECQADVLTWCEAGQVTSVDCSTNGSTCAWNQSGGFNDCSSSGSAAAGSSGGGSGGSPSEPSTSDCGSVSPEGECSGDLLIYCSAESLVTVQCTGGTTCAWNSEASYYDCL